MDGRFEPSQMDLRRYYCNQIISAPNSSLSADYSSPQTLLVRRQASAHIDTFLRRLSLVDDFQACRFMTWPRNACSYG